MTMNVSDRSCRSYREPAWWLWPLEFPGSPRSPSGRSYCSWSAGDCAGEVRKFTWKSDFILKPNFLQQNQHTENRPTVCLVPWTQLNEVCNHVQVIINTSLCYCLQLKARVSHWHHSGDGICWNRAWTAEKEELINWTCCDTVVLQTTVFLLSARLSRENISGFIWTGQGALVTMRMVQSEYSLLPHVVVLPEFIENEAWFICQPLNCDAAKMQKQERGRKLCNR